MPDRLERFKLHRYCDPVSQADWPGRVALAVATEVRRYREDRKMSAKQLSDRCGQLGMDIPRAVLANLENGRRSTVTVAELLVLAQALEVPPLLLVVPLARQESVEILPGLNTPTWDAAKWLRGDGTQITVLGEGPRVTKDATRNGPLDRVMEHEDLVTHWEI